MPWHGSSPAGLRRLAAVALCVLAMAGSRPALAEDGDESGLDAALAQARRLETEIVTAVRRVRSAAVTIVGRRAPERGATGPAKPRSLSAVGSGVLIGWRGTAWVLTNQHVVSGERYIEAVLPGGTGYALRVRATSRPLDLALLAFEQPPRGLQPIALDGASGRTPGEGAWVVATGNPFYLGLDGTPVATLGILSGVRPPDPEAYLDAPTIQHDAEINPGSSGGAVWDLHGQLVGVNGTIATRERRPGGGPAHTGASFAVPLDAVLRFLRSTFRTTAPALRPISRPTVRPTTARPTARQPGPLGVNFRTGRDDAGHASGAVVVGVDRGGPAASGSSAARLQSGDLVDRLGVGGRTYVVRAAADVDRILARHEPGSPITVRFRRAGRTLVWSGRTGAP